MTSVERSVILADSKQQTSITLNFNKEEINIGNKEETGILKITSAATLGKAYDECDMDIYGDDLKIGFNQRYLYEALKVIKEEKVLLKLESATKALVILPYDEKTKDINADVNGSEFLYLVLPVRMRD